MLVTKYFSSGVIFIMASGFLGQTSALLMTTVWYLFFKNDAYLFIVQYSVYSSPTVNTLTKTSMLKRMVAVTGRVKANRYEPVSQQFSGFLVKQNKYY